jgi:ABC-2 type transport system ATP-binding protein
LPRVKEGTAVVETFGLTKRYGARAALDDCTVAVRRGEVFGLHGPNGAGKTTLLRLLLGFLWPTSGRATIDSLDCQKRSLEVRRRVAYMPGEVRLFPRMRGESVLRFFAHVRPGGDMARSRELARRLDLDLTRHVAYMSTGMRQKLALAATIATQAPLLILDEPTSNLDPTVRGEVLALVAEARAAGRTVLFSSHVLAEVEEVCDRVAILRQGRLVHLQEMADLRRRHSIVMRLEGDLPAAPAPLAEGLEITRGRDGEIIVETDRPLPPLLGWLATLPVTEMQVQPVGLRSIYRRWHSSVAPLERPKD